MKNLMFFLLLLIAVRMNGQIKTEHLERQITLDVGSPAAGIVGCR